ncbi:MAG: ABC transporter ATP-binding protein [Elusimicrobia bacterium]|nr:ABC transporter ATP-binding protein [Elusimicrobiota bacterium]MBU2614737.1 ABC transporter ATP-binding protein [Elusimicrobiota bacterium]
MIKIEKLTKIFYKNSKEIYALKDIDLLINSGEFISIMGSSGSGKTTLLFSIAGLIKPASGSIHIDDTPIFNITRRERARLRALKIGFVFQLFYLVPYLTAMENVLLPFLAKKNDPDAINKARRALERVGLQSRLDHKPEELSVGERQRVGIARALVTGPRIILADEPTGNLDTENTAIVLKYLKEINQEGVTVVLTTHGPQVSQQVSRQVKLENGTIV